MLTEVNLPIVAEPLRWVTMVGIHVCERDGEVNKVEIEVVKTPVCELFLRRCFSLHYKARSACVDLGHEKILT